MVDVDKLYTRLSNTVKTIGRVTGEKPSVLKITSEEFEALKEDFIKFTGKIPTERTFMGVPLEVIANNFE
ncbi:hypothetical protein [Clostridium gasigenes]|uniref:Uncharacterized protein n=1 Tax=Clostridium gasigenes TaxID=94869 RepID=A0A1H0N3Q9_9CLOT|nr:hypothetical protein [Clostridium gasigenes]SDO87307.1 hypothetical protein SAMN04488529_101678 [Clostridium gasigenes]